MVGVWKRREEGPVVDVEDYIKQTEYCAMRIIFLKGLSEVKPKEEVV